MLCVDVCVVDCFEAFIVNTVFIFSKILDKLGIKEKEK